MHLYQKYILNLLAKFYGIIILTFVVIVILTQFLKLINKYIGKGINLVQFLYAIILATPDMLVNVSPIALFCAIIVAYHKLINDNELVILESSGLSKYKIAKISMFFAVMITAINLIITSIISPLATRTLKRQQTTIQDNYVSNMLEEGVFNNISNSTTIYIDKKSKNNDLFGIVMYDNAKGSQAIISAEKAKFIFKKGQMKLIMFNGIRQEINKQGQLDVLYFEQSKFDLLKPSVKSSTKSKKPEELVIYDLIFNAGNNSNSAILKELHRRISWPLLNLLLASIALLSASSTNFSRRWSPRTVLNGAIAASISIFLFFSINSLSQKNTNIHLANYAYILLTTAFCAYLLKRLSSKNITLKKILYQLYDSVRHAKKL